MRSNRWVHAECTQCTVRIDATTLPNLFRIFIIKGVSLSFAKRFAMRLPPNGGLFCCLALTREKEGRFFSSRRARIWWAINWRTLSCMFTHTHTHTIAANESMRAISAHHMHGGHQTVYEWERKKWCSLRQSGRSNARAQINWIDAGTSWRRCPYVLLHIALDDDEWLRLFFWIYPSIANRKIRRFALNSTIIYR